MKLKFKHFLIALGFLCFAVFLVHLSFTKTAVYGDGVYYYSIARSLAFDGNLDFTNEFIHFKIYPSYTSTGYSANKYPPGVSLIWTVVISLTFQVINSLNFFGFNFVNEGYSNLFQITIALANITLAIMGLYLLYQTLLNYFNEKASRYAVLATALTTNLLFYMAFDLINSHALSFFASSLFMFYVVKFTKRFSYANWFILGLLGGFIALVRTQDIILILPAIFLLFSIAISKRKKLLASLLFVCGIVISFLPQLIYWQIVFGRLTSPYLSGSEGFNLLNPHFYGLLLNQDTGLMIYTPTLLVAFIGLIVLKISKPLKISLVLTILLNILLIASWSSWDQGASFGVRMLVSSLPLFAFGFAVVVGILLKLISLKKLVIYLLMFTTINLALIIVYLLTH